MTGPRSRCCIKCAPQGRDWPPPLRAINFLLLLLCLVLQGEGGGGREQGGPTIGGSSGGAQIPSVSRTDWRPGSLRGEGGGRRSTMQPGRDLGRGGKGCVCGMGYVCESADGKVTAMWVGGGGPGPVGTTGAGVESGRAGGAFPPVRASTTRGFPGCQWRVRRQGEGKATTVTMRGLLRGRLEGVK